MIPQVQLGIFQDRIGYHFTNPDLLQLALTHASAGGSVNYERLEFLGDRVLGLVIADLLYKIFPQESEGGLAKRHAALVSTETLAQIALALELQDIVIAAHSERLAVGMTQENLLADCMEALIGAAYLDRGFQGCVDLITPLWGDRVYTMQQPPMDPKTTLQEWAQARRLAVPAYEVVAKTGPDHAPQFTMSVTVKGFDPMTATGASRRAAEKEAARLLLEKLAKYDD